MDQTLPASAPREDSALTSAVSVDAAPKNAAIAKKLSRMMTQLSLEDEELRASLRDLGTFYTHNTLNERRNLRTTLEHRMQLAHQQFFDEFSKVNQELVTIQLAVKQLSESCDLIAERLSASKIQNREFLKRANEIEQQLRLQNEDQGAAQLQQTPVENVLTQTSEHQTQQQ